MAKLRATLTYAEDERHLDGKVISLLHHPIDHGKVSAAAAAGHHLGRHCREHCLRQRVVEAVAEQGRPTDTNRIHAYGLGLGDCCGCCCCCTIKLELFGVGSRVSVCVLSNI